MTGVDAGCVKTLVGLKSCRQGVLLPEFLDDYVGEDNPVRAIDVFFDELIGRN